MDMTGIGEAAQFIQVVGGVTANMANVGFEALKLTGGFAHFVGHELIKLTKLLLFSERKTDLKAGEVKLSALVKDANNKGANLGVLSIPDELKNEFTDYCKQAGVSYVILPDVNSTDGKFEAMYVGTHANQMIMERYMADKKGQVLPYSLKEYANNAIPSEMLAMENDLRVNAPQQYAMLKDIEKDLGSQNKGSRFESFEIDKSQIVGVTPDVVELTLRDGNNERYYVDIPRSSLKKEGDDFIVALDKNQQYDVNTSRGLIKNADGKSFIDVRNERSTPSFACDATMIMGLTNADKDFRVKTQDVGQKFSNSKSKDLNVITFPTRSVADNKINFGSDITDFKPKNR